MRLVACSLERQFNNSLRIVLVAVLNKSQPAFVGFRILKHKKATDVFFSQIHLELLQRIVSLCRILQIVLGN